MKQFSNIGFLLIAISIIITGCDKGEQYPLSIPPAVSHFTSTDPYVTYYVRNTTDDSFIIQIGTSDVSTVDRTVTFNINSPSGAVAGTDYSIITPASGNTAIIKAGTAVSSVKIKGTFDSYLNGKQDTLVVTLSEPSITVAKFSDTMKVVLKAYCDVDVTNFLGIYDNNIDTQAGEADYGPYEIDISSSGVTSTGATTGYVIMRNFADYGSDIRVDLDWTDPANFNTSVAPQFLFKHPTYGNATIAGVGKGSFSSCDNTFKISYKLTVAAGSFGNFITYVAR